MALKVSQSSIKLGSQRDFLLARETKELPEAVVGREEGSEEVGIEIVQGKIFQGIEEFVKVGKEDVDLGFGKAKILSLHNVVPRWRGQAVRERERKSLRKCQSRRE